MDINNKYYDLLKPYMDIYGLLALPGNDEGDSTFNEGSASLLLTELYVQNKISHDNYLFFKNRYEDIFNKLKQANGSLNRGINPATWVSQPGGVIMSRDQWIPNVIATGSMGLKSQLNFLFLNHLFRRGLLFTTNTCPNDEIVGKPGYKWKMPDITVLDSWGLYIRAYKFWLFYPLLFVFDLQILVQSVILLHSSYFNPGGGDVPNHLNTIIQAYRVMPTPISWLARKLLNFCKLGLLKYINTYITTDNGAPPLGQLYQDVLSGI